MKIVTYNCFYVRSLECGQTKVSYLHHTGGTIDKDIITFQVSVDNWRRSCVQVIQPLQYLSPPTTDYLGPDIFKTSQVTKNTRHKYFSLNSNLYK